MQGHHQEKTKIIRHPIHTKDQLGPITHSKIRNNNHKVVLNQHQNQTSSESDEPNRIKPIDKRRQIKSHPEEHQGTPIETTESPGRIQKSHVETTGEQKRNREERTTTTKIIDDPLNFTPRIKNLDFRGERVTDGFGELQ